MVGPPRPGKVPQILSRHASSIRELRDAVVQLQSSVSGTADGFEHVQVTMVLGGPQHIYKLAGETAVTAWSFNAASDVSDTSVVAATMFVRADDGSALELGETGVVYVALTPVALGHATVTVRKPDPDNAGAFLRVIVFHVDVVPLPASVPDTTSGGGGGGTPTTPTPEPGTPTTPTPEPGTTPTPEPDPEPSIEHPVTREPEGIWGRTSTQEGNRIWTTFPSDTSYPNTIREYTRSSAGTLSRNASGDHTLGLVLGYTGLHAARAIAVYRTGSGVSNIYALVQPGSTVGQCHVHFDQVRDATGSILERYIYSNTDGTFPINATGGDLDSVSAAISLSSSGVGYRIYVCDSDGHLQAGSMILNVDSPLTSQIYRLARAQIGLNLTGLFADDTDSVLWGFRHFGAPSSAGWGSPAQIEFRAYDTRNMARMSSRDFEVRIPSGTVEVGKHVWYEGGNTAYILLKNATAWYAHAMTIPTAPAIAPTLRVNPARSNVVIPLRIFGGVRVGTQIRRPNWSSYFTPSVAGHTVNYTIEAVEYFGTHSGSLQDAVEMDNTGTPPAQLYNLEALGLNAAVGTSLIDYGNVAWNGLHTVAVVTIKRPTGTVAQQVNSFAPQGNHFRIAVRGTLSGYGTSDSEQSKIHYIRIYSHISTNTQVADENPSLTIQRPDMSGTLHYQNLFEDPPDDGTYSVSSPQDDEGSPLFEYELDTDDHILTVTIPEGTAASVGGESYIDLRLEQTLDGEDLPLAITVRITVIVLAAYEITARSGVELVLPPDGEASLTVNDLVEYTGIPISTTISLSDLALDIDDTPIGLEVRDGNVIVAASDNVEDWNVASTTATALVEMDWTNDTQQVSVPFTVRTNAVDVQVHDNFPAETNRTMNTWIIDGGQHAHLNLPRYHFDIYPSESEVTTGYAYQLDLRAAQYLECYFRADRPSTLVVHRYNRDNWEGEIQVQVTCVGTAANGDEDVAVKVLNYRSH